MAEQLITLSVDYKQVTGYHVDYEQSLIPLRDSRGKRTSEQTRKSPAALKRDARVEPLVYGSLH